MLRHLSFPWEHYSLVSTFRLPRSSLKLPWELQPSGLRRPVSQLIKYEHEFPGCGCLEFHFSTNCWQFLNKVLFSWHFVFIKPTCGRVGRPFLCCSMWSGGHFPGLVLGNLCLNMEAVASFSPRDFFARWEVRFGLYTPGKTGTGVPMNVWLQAQWGRSSQPDYWGTTTW